MRSPKRSSQRPSKHKPKSRPGGPAPQGGPTSPGPLGMKPSSRPGYKPRDLGALRAPRPSLRRPGKPDPALAARGMVEKEVGPAGPARVVSHVVPLDKLASSAVDVALAVERSVLGEGRRADRAIAHELRFRRDLALPDHRFIAQAVFALFRWKGWIDTLHIGQPEARLLLAWMLDSPKFHPACRIWARAMGRDAERMVPVGDAPNWTARGDGWKRLNDNQTVSADPWRLFPDWLREHLPLPPGGGSPKAKYLELLQSFQARPSLWVRAQAADEAQVWAELNELGLKPWVHRRVGRAAKLGPEADVHHLAAFERGDLEIQDLASQAVAMACDPDPGERWWDVCAGAGGKAIHLTALMGGKGVVVASDIHEGRLKEAARRARRSPFRNLSTKVWDGKHVVGKAGKYDGVLVDAPCSGIGTWRRNPDARWTLKPEALVRLAQTQAQVLRTGALGVKPGGTLVYAVCTLTIGETQGVLRGFLGEHPQFQLDPFPHPLTGEPTDGTLQIWPQDADTDAMFIARMIRTDSPSKPMPKPKSKSNPAPQPDLDSDDSTGEPAGPVEGVEPRDAIDPSPSE